MPKESAGAGFIYNNEHIRLPIPAGAGQATSVLSYPVARNVAIIAVKLVTVITATGAGANRTFNIRKGSATGAVIATGTVTLANQAAVGAVLDIPVSAGAVAGAPLIDSDTLTIEWPAAGAVAFTAGEIDVVLVVRQRLQAKN